MATSAEMLSIGQNLNSFTGNCDVSILVKNSRMGQKTQNEQTKNNPKLLALYKKRGMGSCLMFQNSSTWRQRQKKTDRL